MMTMASSVDLLDAHADALFAPEIESWPTSSPGDSGSATPAATELMALAEQVQMILIPIHPSPTFVDGLGHRLAQAAIPTVEVLSPWRRSWIIGATAVGSALSLFGLFQFLRGGRRTLKRAS
jgi:hypothetical protein